jgi:hypothetical protein
MGSQQETATQGSSHTLGPKPFHLRRLHPLGWTTDITMTNNIPSAQDAIGHYMADGYIYSNSVSERQKWMEREDAYSETGQALKAPSRYTA